MTPTKIILFGTGPYSQALAQYILRDTERKLAAFTVHEAYLKEKMLFDVPVIPFEHIERLMPPDQFSMLIGVGPYRINRLRKSFFEQAKDKNYRMASYVHSLALLLGENDYGENCIIYEHAVLKPFVSVGVNVVLGSSCNIHHHTRIQDHCFISSGAIIGGNTVIETGSYVGLGAVIRDGVTIARNTVVGAGAVITENTEENSVYRAEGTRKMPIKADQLKHI